MDDIIIHLDEPAGGATILTDRVSVRGWAALAASGAAGLSVRIAVELPALRPSFHFAGIPLSGAFVTQCDVSIGARKEAVPGLPPGWTSVEVELELDLGRLFPALAGTEQLVALSLVAEAGERIAVSNKSTISVPPAAARALPRGGLFAPLLSRPLVSDFLIVEGWAVSPSSDLSSVELMVNGASAGRAASGLPSRDVAAFLPAIEPAKQARFSAALKRDRIAADVSDLVELCALCRFADGAEVAVRSAPFLWEPRAALAERGAIERVAENEGRTLAIEGWVLPFELAAPAFYVGPPDRMVEILESPPCGVSAVQRPDIDESVPWAAGLRDSGFRAVIDRRLSAESGAVSFAVRHGESERRLGSRSAHRVVRELLLDGGRPRIKTASAAAARRAARELRDRLRPAAASEPDPHAPILFASHNLSPVEGAPKVLCEVARSLVAAGWPAERISAVSAVEGALRASYEERGIRVDVVSELELHGISRERYFDGLRAVEALAAERAPALVFANVVDAFWGADFAARRGIPVLWGIHESVPPLSLYAELDRVLRSIFLDRLTRADRVIFVAERTRELFADVVDPGRATVIPNGIPLERIEAARGELSRADARRELGVAGGEEVIAIIGTTTERKGQDVFLREMALLAAARPARYRFFVVGARRIPFLDALEALASELGFGEELVLVPETPEVAVYYRAADLMVIASREESAPLVSLEALAFGSPLVSTGVFGLAEQLTDEYDALIFEPAREGHLAEQAARILGDPRLAERLVRNGKETVRSRFSLSSSMAHYRDEIEAALERA